MLLISKFFGRFAFSPQNSVLYSAFRRGGAIRDNHTFQTRRSLSGTINVLVRDKETLQESIITYKSFKDTSHRFNLIGQVDDSGKLMDSDPNLSPQHQRRIPEKKAADVADFVAGDKDDVSIEEVKSPVLYPVEGQIHTGPTPQIVIDMMMAEANKIAEEIAVEHFNTHPNDGADFNALDNEPLFTLPEPSHTSSEQPIKQRKKPGPKPKNKEAHES